MIADILLCALAYLCGSLSSAILICRATGLPDPRTRGSGNPGATNVLRYGGRGIAATVFVGDLLKGLLPVMLGSALDRSHVVIALMGLFAFAGHLWPVFFGFRGGKGVATAFGVLLGWAWPAALAAAVAWLIAALAFRISSASALMAAVAAPLALWLLQAQSAYTGSGILMSLVLVWRHRSNIRNLLSRSEPRIGQGR